jgi:hypothetical protein
MGGSAPAGASSEKGGESSKDGSHGGGPEPEEPVVEAASDGKPGSGKDGSEGGEGLEPQSGKLLSESPDRSGHGGK